MARKAMSAFSFGKWLALGAIALMAPALAACAPREPAPASEAAVSPLQIGLPASLEGERDSYLSEVTSAVGDVRAFFEASGLEAPADDIVSKAIVFEETLTAREFLASKYGVDLENVPTSFSGTVDGDTLFIVSRAAYEQTWRSLYPEWPWAETNYHQLIVHELSHRAHEALAIAQFGSADAMGPTWFFEGFAIMCAGQFDAEGPPPDLAELRELIGDGREPNASYPLYGRIMRGLVALYGVKKLVSSASTPGFPDTLWESQLE